MPLSIDVNKVAIKLSKYCVCLLLIYLAYVAINYSYFIHTYKCKSNHQKKILLIWGDGTGEREQTYRFQIAARNLGINLKVISYKQSALLPFSLRSIAKAAELMKPDLILTIERSIPAVDLAPNYLVLDQSVDAYIYKIDNKDRVMRTLFNFYGVLPTFPELDSLKSFYMQAHKKFRGFRWYPTVQKTIFINRPAKRLFYPGGILKDITRSSDKYKKLFALLDNYPYMEIRGSKKIWSHTPKSRKAPIQFNGISLLQAQNDAGISLVLHDAEHLNYNVPSSRIFEAAAANTVIISDTHQFVIDNFGKNALYIDITAPAPQIAQQIHAHVQWIKTHPKEAAQMANACHDIFLNNFSLENQLEHLLSMHKEYADD